MVKVSFNSALGQKEPKKDENSEALIITDKDPEDVIVPLRRQSRVWCWCMCLGLALMLSGVVVGGAYLYRYFILQEGDVFFCGLTYRDTEDYRFLVPEIDSVTQAPQYHTINANFQILRNEEVELINVPVPEFGDSDPANIVHDFQRLLTAYLDLSLNKCYVIPLNTSIVMPPRNLFEILINIKTGTYLPQSYLVREELVVTDRIKDVNQLGFFISRLCRSKETFRLQRRNISNGIQKRSVKKCNKIIHFANNFAVETLICE
ncbi:integral membrane protein 2B [Callorhinchus milii]|uniref:Integral membrane protein 2 n=1 Tax=Callorhinchus milii TaxID=7868 RepID=V9KYS6_CALMI|nr:integral membrane protein 2B [Callorhinchus milii]|eukprot:gi/632937387/ref/XP_007899445.1/ PREDICTED: integral membrane protein 2B [Callorhinchus milii]